MLNTTAMYDNTFDRDFDLAVEALEKEYNEKAENKDN